LLEGSTGAARRDFTNGWLVLGSDERVATIRDVLAEELWPRQDAPDAPYSSPT
jgi:hypothetical protein